MAGYTYANTSLFTGYLLAKTDESIYVFTIHLLVENTSTPTSRGLTAGSISNYLYAIKLPVEQDLWIPRSSPERSSLFIWEPLVGSPYLSEVTFLERSKIVFY